MSAEVENKQASTISMHLAEVMGLDMSSDLPAVCGTDVFTPEKRSEVMSLIRSKNTKPELLVRSLLHRLGYRFRLHRKDLPGKPDIVLPKHKTIIFVHGCYWHPHPNCKERKDRKPPKQNADYWRDKFARNLERDATAQRELEATGWRVIVLYECEMTRGRTLTSEKLALIMSTPETHND